MKKILFLFFPLILLLTFSQALAFVIGPSNFSLYSYPEHNCYEPDIPYTRDRFSVDMLNSDLEEYRICIEDYLEAADNDIERVIEERNKAVDEFNSFVNLIN